VKDDSAVDVADIVYDNVDSASTTVGLGAKKPEGPSGNFFLPICICQTQCDFSTSRSGVLFALNTPYGCER